MQLLKNLIRHHYSQFNRKLKSGQTSIDELSLFLIVSSVIILIIMMILRLQRYVYMTWFLLLIAYWRTYSKNKLRRSKENQVFTKYYYPISAFSKNAFRGLTVRRTHVYFNCNKCSQQLRFPKKTGHIKVTCPKCHNSFIKKTIRGYAKMLKAKN